MTETLLMKYVKNTGREIAYHIYLSGEALLSSGENYDIVLLDIELKNKNGLEIAALLRKRSRAKIIFITSHIEEMSNGYKVRAFRFLTKPIKETMFNEAIESAIEEISSVKKLELQSDLGMVVVHNKDIVYVEAGNHSSCVRTVGGVFRSPLILSELRGKLTGREFFSPHRSYIINMDYIREIGTNEVLMHNGERVQLSRLKQREFKQLFYQYLRGKTNGYD